MGHQIYASDSRDGVFFTAGAWQVINWCERFTPRVKPEGMSDWQWADELCGVSEATADAVRTADERVPLAYEDAEKAGLVNANIDAVFFEQCRRFLRDTAKRGASISGSY
jgi:hypothetical protein